MTPQPPPATPLAADAVADELRELEHERCRAISEFDLVTLERLLDPDLSHTHANGMTQDREAYLAALAGRPRITRPGAITVRCHGDVAILTGTLTNAFGSGSGSPRTGELHALRVWRRDGGDWRLLAFAASGPLEHRAAHRDG
jgi:hypothetical protein